MYTYISLEIIIDLPIGFPINNISSLRFYRSDFSQCLMFVWYGCLECVTFLCAHATVLLFFSLVL